MSGGTVDAAFAELGCTARARIAVYREAYEVRALAQLALEQATSAPGRSVARAEEYLDRIKALLGLRCRPAADDTSPDLQQRVQAIGRPLAQFLTSTAGDADGDEPLPELPREIAADLLRRLLVLCDDLRRGIHDNEGEADGSAAPN